MIVDDEPDIRDMLDLLLRGEGFDTQTAVNGTDFLEKVDSFNPDLVTLDVMMPGPSVPEIVERLKKKKSKPKIILLTVVRNFGSKKLFEEGNIVDYIEKPFDINDFLDTIKKHLEKEF
jgi:DNA-binding response OmpR family regulator